MQLYMYMMEKNSRFRFQKEERCVLNQSVSFIDTVGCQNAPPDCNYGGVGRARLG